MEKYGDLITNGLDLISFLLVTPEIVKVIAPAATNFIGAVIIVCAANVMWLLLVVAPTLLVMGQFPLWISIGSAVLFAGPAVLMFRVRRFQRALELVDWLSIYLSRHFLAVGVVLFLISRLIAFYGSWMKVSLP